MSLATMPQTGRLHAKVDKLVPVWGTKNPAAVRKAIVAIAHTLLKIAYRVLRVNPTPQRSLSPPHQLQKSGKCRERYRPYRLASRKVFITTWSSASQTPSAGRDLGGAGVLA